jgi:hypothetical protein
VPWLSLLSRVLSGGSNAAARSEVFEVRLAAEDPRLNRNVSAVAPDRISNRHFEGSRQAEKLLPQPQVLTAFGFSKVKPRFSSPS